MAKTLQLTSENFLIITFLAAFQEPAKTKMPISLLSAILFCSRKKSFSTAEMNFTLKNDNQNASFES